MSKRIGIAIISLLLTVCAWAQLPPNYRPDNSRVQVIGEKVDSILTIPRFCGEPRFPAKAWIADGAVALDTCNHIFYARINGGWERMAKYNEIGALSDSVVWKINGNGFELAAIPKFGTTSNSDLNIITAGVIRAVIPKTGIVRNNADSLRCLAYDTLQKVFYYKNCGSSTVYLDTMFVRNDSLYYKKNGSEYFVKKLQPYGTIAGLLSAGTNVTVTGSGTTGSPYVISSSGGGSTLQQVLTAGSTLLSSQTIGMESAVALRFDQDPGALGYIFLNNGSDTIFSIEGSSAFFKAPTLFIKNTPYTLSTTGKKIMLRDTATGLVQNIDPALIGGGSSSSTPTGVINYNYRNIIDSTFTGRDLSVTGIGVPTVSANIFASGIDGLRYATGQQAVGEPARWVLPAGDWTIEFRAKRTVQGVVQSLFGVWRTLDSVKSYRCYFDASGNLNFQGYNATATSSSTVTDSTAHQYAIVKSGANTSIYIDGSRVAGPTAITYDTADSYIPFTMANTADYSNATGGTPFTGVIGDFRFSATARYSGASYTPATTKLLTDSVTIALLNPALANTYISGTSFQSNILTRTGYSQARGGWANPDGFFRTPTGGYAFSVSAFDSTQWTVWLVTSPTLAGPWTVNGTVLQDPETIEADLAGNGTVWPWKGKYYHWYHTSGSSALGIRASQSDNLYAQFPEGTTVLNPLDYGYTSFVDPYVRPSDDGTFLEMWFSGVDGVRYMLYSTSTDGITWTDPIRLIVSNAPGYTNNPGEPSVIKIGETYNMFGDGSQGGSGRQISRWISKDKYNWVPAGLFHGASGSPYISAFDESVFLDTANNRLILLFANSENTASTQPTASDIGMRYAPIVGLDTVVNTWDHYATATGDINEIGFFKDRSNLTSNNNFKINQSRKEFQLGVIGSIFSMDANPYSMNFGSQIGTSTNGGAKIKLFQAGNDSIFIGIGSDGALVFNSTSGSTGLRFRAGSVNRLEIDGNYTTLTNTLGVTLAPVSGTTPTILSWSNTFGGPAMRFYSGYEMGLYSSEWRTTVGGGARISFVTGSTEHINFTSGQLNLLTAGSKLNIATGSNASIGVSGAMTAGTITISTTAVTSSSKIFLTHASVGGTQGFLSVGTITNGTSFVINSSSATDTGTVNWWIIN